MDNKRQVDPTSRRADSPSREGGGGPAYRASGVDRESPRSRKSKPRWWWMSHVSPSRLGQHAPRRRLDARTVPTSLVLERPRTDQPVCIASVWEKAPGRPNFSTCRQQPKASTEGSGVQCSHVSQSGDVQVCGALAITIGHQVQVVGGSISQMFFVCNLREHNPRMNAGANTQTVLSSILGFIICPS